MWVAGSCQFSSFLGAFAKLRKATIFFSPCPSVCPPAWNNSAPTRRIFTKFDIWRFHPKICRENFIKIVQEYRVLYMTTNIHFLIISSSLRLRMRNVSDKNCREKIKIHILCSLTFFFRKSSRLWENVEKYFWAGQDTDDNMAHAHCMLDT
jgi:hypothetical protein